MRRGSLALLIALAPAAAWAAAEDTWVRQAQAAEARFDSAEALKCYLAADAASPNQVVILQKIARQYSDLANSQPTTAEKKAYAQHALDYSEQAVKLDPNNAVSVLSLAISHAKLAIWSDLHEKIAYSRLVKEEAERAIALDPQYAWAHHILGCWYYEVADLSGTARLLLRIFYGGLPAASAADGVRELERAVALEPGELDHHVELGFACLSAGNEAEARVQFGEALSMPCRANYDAEAQARARTALARLGPASPGDRS